MYKVGDIVITNHDEIVKPDLRGKMFKVIELHYRTYAQGIFQYKLEHQDPKLRRITKARYMTVCANDVHLITRNDIRWWKEYG